jgi:hypothetical protein
MANAILSETGHELIEAVAGLMLWHLNKVGIRTAE